MTQISLAIMWNTGKRLKICSKNLRSSNRRAISKHSLSFLTHTGESAQRRTHSHTRAVPPALSAESQHSSVPAGSCPSTLVTLKFTHSNVLKSSEETLAGLLARGKCQVTKPGLRTHRGPPGPLHFTLSSTQWLIGEIYGVQRSRV